jgi:hypothetical protein
MPQSQVALLEDLAGLSSQEEGVARQVGYTSRQSIS